MRNLVAGSLIAAALSFGLAGMPALAADADPTVQQIYEAARSGHLDQAQQMMNQVLRDHPESSKAHYVQSELYARESNAGAARSELARAEQLDPGLTKENPRSVQELKTQLGLVRRNTGSFGGMTTAAPSATHFPWAPLVILALVVGVFWMLFRRRRSYYPAAGAPGAYGPGGYAGPGPGPGYGPYAGGPGGVAGGGIGSNIAGGLAGGLAAGAGIVAGEEIAHHFLDGDRRQGLPPAGDDGSGGSGNPNSDMGGSDFGVNDPGSWDDSSGGGDFGGGDGGGGGDWS